MRISQSQAQKIREIVEDILGSSVQVWLFGSRVDDSASGGDIDLLISTNQVIESPAQLSGRLTVAVMRLFYGRKVDILLEAPNLKHQSIHDIAKKQGVLL